MTTRPHFAGYELPAPQLSSDDARKLAGLDVHDLTDRELFAEGVLVAAALAEAIVTRCRVWLEWFEPPYTISASDWLEDRLRRVQAETRKRRGSRA